MILLVESLYFDLKNKKSLTILLKEDHRIVISQQNLCLTRDNRVL